ncbi:MAG: diaminopimelate decarboxylase [bacterium]
MNLFNYDNETLFCERVSVKKIAGEVGTPVYIYSFNTLKRHYEAFSRSFKELDHLICFAVKANSSLAILQSLGSWGAGADIVSGGELFRAQKAGIDPGKTVYAGVGKLDHEIEAALNAGILFFNVESITELEQINEIASRMGTNARVALRVNPDVDPQTHPYISTGLKKNKFGVSIRSAPEVFAKAASMSHIEPVGVHVHIGSQITRTAPFEDSLTRIAALVKALRNTGINLSYLNLGGGIGIKYHDEEPPPLDEFAAKLLPIIKSIPDCKVVFEPGRVIAGNAGILVTRVLSVKETDLKKFVIVDAGMNDLARPSLYNSYHAIIPVTEKNGSFSEETVDVVGPICESGDFLAKDRTIKACAGGELLAVNSAGAYGFSMSSNYNSRARAAEVLVKRDEYRIIRRRETYNDLIRGEEIPNF